MRAAQYCADIRAVAEAAEVLGPMRFALLGEVRDLTRNPVVDPSGREVRDPLLQALESELYRRLYCRPRPGGAPAGTDPAEERAFIGALSRANQGRGTWESGWRVAGVEPDGQIAVTKDQVTFWARPSQVRVSGGAGPQGHAPGAPEPGALCSVRLGKEIRHLFPAFYMALGNALPEGRPLLRLYWHLTPEAAVRYMRLVTEGLGGAGIPFRTKVLSHLRQYLRADAGVLYLARSDFDRARPVIARVYREIRALLHPAVPLFTRPLAPGLGLAEDPGGGLSFGQSRCRIAAEGLVRAHAEGAQLPAARAERMAAAFRERGLDPLCPYLEPGSRDTYTFEPDA